MGFNEVPKRPDHCITQGDIGLVGNGLEYVFFVRGNADCHDPVASFWDGVRGFFVLFDAIKQGKASRADAEQL